MLIKLWDWEKKWSCSQVFEGHTHYVMQIVFNPKDNNTFASASLDRTVKVCRLPYIAKKVMGVEKGNKEMIKGGSANFTRCIFYF